MDTEFLVGAMGNEVIEQDLGLHYIKLSDNRNKVINHNYITLNERVRDIIISKNKKLIVIFLETSSSIAVLSKINNWLVNLFIKNNSYTGSSFMIFKI